MTQERTTAQEKQGAAASLLNGFAVLEALATSSRPQLGVTEISAIVDLHKSTVSRMLTGLAEAGYVERDESTGRYRLGLGMIGLAGPLLAELDIRRVAAPYLEELTDATGETSAIAIWNGAEGVVVEQYASPHQVKHSASIGTRYHRFASSSVRVFLAALPDEEVERLLSPDGSIRFNGSLEEARAALAEVREAGVAINDGGTTIEEYGVSAPVHDYRGEIAGCLTASAPRTRVQHLGTQEMLMEAVLETAATITARLGGREGARG